MPQVLVTSPMKGRFRPQPDGSQRIWRPVAGERYVAVLWVVVAVFGVLGSLLIATSAWLPMVALLALFGGAAVVVLGLGEVPQAGLRLLMPLAALVVVCNPLLQHVAHVPAGYVLELVLFGLLIGAVFKARQHCRGDRTLSWVLGLFVLYLGLSFLSSLAGRSQFVAGLWQFQYNLKWLAMFLVGAMLVWDDRAERLLRVVLLTVWVPALAMVMLEAVAPSAHRMLLGPSPDTQFNPFLGGLRRYRGPFLHAGYLALVSALLAWFAIVQLVQTRRLSWALLGGLYVVLLVVSGQRQELAGFVLALSLFAVVRGRAAWPVLFTGGLLLVGAVVTLMLLFEFVPMARLLAQWGVGDPMAALSERAILTQRGLDVANQYFPLGAGLGTYGGAGAQKFDQSLFLDLGFGRYWWFREGKFLVDVYWPSVAAEVGWLGMGALAACYALIFGGLLSRLLRSGGTGTALTLATGAMLILLTNTPSSAIITDPRGSFLAWLIIGAAWRASQQQRPPSGLPESTDRRTAWTS